jgi:hypothetical protein
VKLTRWEHTGYYDLRLAAEASQRKLHKCRRQAVAAARRPVTPLLSRVAAALGAPVVRALVAGLSVDAALDAAAAEAVADSSVAGQAAGGSPVAPGALAEAANAADKSLTDGGGADEGGTPRSVHVAVMVTLRGHVAAALEGARLLVAVGTTCTRGSGHVAHHAAQV